MDNKLKKYYVGARHIGEAIGRNGNAACTRDTIDEAVEDAKREIRKGETDCVVVVEIIRIVRKYNPPISVEAV